MPDDQRTDSTGLKVLRRLFVVLLVLTIAVVFYRQAFDGAFPWDSHQFRSSPQTQVVTQNAAGDQAPGTNPVDDLAFASLDTTQRSLYVLLLAGEQEHLESISFSASQSSDVQRAYDAVLRDNPELIWVGTSCTLEGDDSAHITTVRPVYLLDEEESTQARADLEQHAASILSQIQQTDAAGRARAIHDAVITSGRVEGVRGSASMQEVFSKGDDSDDWYARCFQYLMRRDGRSCSCIGAASAEGGEETSRLLDVARVDGASTFVDCARDADGSAVTGHDWFGFGDERFYSEYALGEGQTLPACSPLPEPGA